MELKSKCPCGTEFWVAKWQLSCGRGKYCSKSCVYKYHKRKSGLKYILKKENPTSFKKGHIPWHAGKSVHLSPKTEIKIGQHLSPKTEFKNNDYRISGSNNIWWKGGITPLNQKIRHSPEYKEWRKQVFERDNYTCQLCNERGIKIHADHIKPFATYSELRFDINNGRTLCVSCHRKTNTFGKGKKGE